MPAEKGRRLKKMYIRDYDGVFRAVEGFLYAETLIFISKSVYTIASTFMEKYGIEEDLVLEEVKK